MLVWSALMSCIWYSRHLGLSTRLLLSRRQPDIRHWFNFLMRKLQRLQKMPSMEEASLGDSCIKFLTRYLLAEQVGQCSLKITYSAHTDLTVKFQSHRSRDYTNPYLPIAPSAIDSTGQVAVGVDGKKMEPESNVLLASIENMQYAVTLDVLHMVFAAFGDVQKIAMFDKNGGLQALIQYKDVQTAVVAKEALEGHCIYDGGFCKLHITYSRHTDLSIKVNNDRSRDYTMPNPPVPMPQQPGQNPYTGNPQQYHAAGGSHQQQQPPQGGWVQPGGQGSMGMGGGGHNPYMAPPSSSSMHYGPGGHMPPQHYGGPGPMH
ncbi:RNA-binding domain superfamily [Arabidopsis suecica]|uniref:RNA-binding domain superfamily n=1 Tax=Arabidopsis suecica TaxID=45249 RepID=A0A8T1Y0K9_ARASU|nr:RNA-binding domain superfamily [Arabidopsis suecica]